MIEVLTELCDSRAMCASTLALTDWHIADWVVASVAILSGIAVAWIAIARWSFFQASPRARVIVDSVGEGWARVIYVGFGVILIALGIWVLAG